MRFIKLWLPVVLWASMIFYVSGIPSLQSNFQHDFILRKMAHVVEYFVLTFLLYRALKNSFNLNSSYFPVCLAAACLLYSVSDEIHQCFIPGRHGSPLDVLIDALGIVGFYAMIKIQRTFARQPVKTSARLVEPLAMPAVEVHVQS